MIGFTCDVRIWGEDALPRFATVLLGLDADSDGPPEIDIRLRDGNDADLVISVDLDDVHEALNALQRQRLTQLAREGSA